MDAEPARRLRDVAGAVAEDSVDVLPLGARKRRRLVVRLGAKYYLSKPADADDIVGAFARGEAPPLEPRPPDSDEYKAPSLARAEWEHINRVLSDAGGNISEAARRLGIHRRSLQRKLQKYPPSK